MAQTYRYTGSNLVGIFNSTSFNADYSEVMFEAKIRVEDKTAGNDTDQSYNTTIKEGKGSIKIFDVGTSIAYDTLFKVGSTATLEIRPQGTGTGLPVFSFTAIITDFKKGMIFDKNVMIEIAYVKSGTMIKDFGSVQ